jgi:hypothetical protein
LYAQILAPLLIFNVMGGHLTQHVLFSIICEVFLKVIFFYREIGVPFFETSYIFSFDSSDAIKTKKTLK